MNTLLSTNNPLYQRECVRDHICLDAHFPCDIGMLDMDGSMLIRQVRTLSPELGGRIQAIAFLGIKTRAIALPAEDLPSLEKEVMLD